MLIENNKIMKKKYSEIFKRFKNFNIASLESLRDQIFDDMHDGKQERNKETLLRLEVIEDLIYMKHYNISVD